MTGALREIWRTPAAAAPMQRLPAARLVAGVGLEGDRYALGGGTWAQYPELEKQLTLIDADDVAAVARETGSALLPGQTRRNLVTTGIELPALVGG
jgi:MOSC domain-containing protein YiiM